MRRTEVIKLSMGIAVERPDQQIVYLPEIDPVSDVNHVSKLIDFIRKNINDTYTLETEIAGEMDAYYNHAFEKGFDYAIGQIKAVLGGEE